VNVFGQLIQLNELLNRGIVLENQIKLTGLKIKLKKFRATALLLQQLHTSTEL
jgi:hypothetical protein